MTYLGLDYGEKRIGLAKADSETRVATPLKTISYEKAEEAADELARVVRDEGIDEVVIGLPVSLDGEERAMAKRVRAFAEGLKKWHVPIHFQSELLSSKQSRRDGVTDVDASAAALILRSFLDQET